MLMTFIKNYYLIRRIKQHLQVRTAFPLEQQYYSLQLIRFRAESMNAVGKCVSQYCNI